MTAETKQRRRGGLATLFFTLFGVVVLLFLLPFSFGIRFYRMPSGSMQPSLYVGDYIMVTKWSYGYGRYSFAPFPGLNERILGHAPARGDLAVFSPDLGTRSRLRQARYRSARRSHSMIDGALYINRQAVQREALGEVSFTDEEGGPVRAQGYRETLPAACLILCWIASRTARWTTPASSSYPTAITL